MIVIRLLLSAQTAAVDAKEAAGSDSLLNEHLNLIGQLGTVSYRHRLSGELFWIAFQKGAHFDRPSTGQVQAVG